MTILPQSVETLARLGANLDITSKTNYLPQSVETIIRLVVGAGGHVTIDAGNYLPQSLEAFVRIGGRNVTIRI